MRLPGRSAGEPSLLGFTAAIHDQALGIYTDGEKALFSTQRYSIFNAYRRGTVVEILSSSASASSEPVWMAPTPDVQEMVIVVFRRKAGC
jgi:hypothetical protein